MLSGATRGTASKALGQNCASSSSSSQQSRPSWNKSTRFGTLAAAATLGVGSIGAVALCEAQKDKSVNHDGYVQATSPEQLLKQIPSELSAEEERLELAVLKAKKHGGGLKLFSGNGNLALSLEIARILGINLGKATVGQFADGEVNVQIHENVRGKDVYIIQPTCPPVNNNLMELLLMVSTLNRASARRITIVIPYPYYGYARQDRKMQVRIWI